MSHNMNMNENVLVLKVTLSRMCMFCVTVACRRLDGTFSYLMTAEVRSIFFSVKKLP